MPRPGTRTERGYGRAYEIARKVLLAGHPPCWWCGKPATTADHVPPLAEVGHPHYNLVPACKPCNSGRAHKRQATPSRIW